MEQGATSVYRYFDLSGRLLYVGVTCRGTKRMSEHASSKVWWPRAATCTVEHYEDRQTALGRESYLIASLQPPYNTMGRAAKGVPFVGPPASVTQGVIGPCLQCGTRGHLSTARRMCRGCEGRRGRGNQAVIQTGQACRVCDAVGSLSKARGLCRTCEGKGSRIIQKLKETA